MCRSDVHVADGDATQPTGSIKRRLIPDHGIADRVLEKGSAVGDLEIGDRAGVPFIGAAVGANSAEKETKTGAAVRKSLASRVDRGLCRTCKARSNHTQEIQNGISAIDLRRFFVWRLTVYRSLKHAGHSEWTTAGSFRVGPLGHLAVQFGRPFGVEVPRIDVSDEKLELRQISWRDADAERPCDRFG
jgi:propanol-preferring alcohol dehydrogenase